MASYTLKEIAEFLDARLEGQSDARVNAINTLDAASGDQLSFLANPLYRKYLPNTQAGVVILDESDAPQCNTNKIVMSNPYLGYAKISHWFRSFSEEVGEIHPSACIHPDAKLGDRVNIGPQVVIEEGVCLEDSVSIAAGSFIGRNTQIAKESTIYPNVTIYHGVSIGERCIIHSGVVIGADGFGFANSEGRWHKIAQLGTVRIGNDVEVGANTTIDRGAISDTLIGDNVILDNQIQIGHNVEIGDYSAIAACTAIAGSVVIGKYCLISGASAIVGHLEICDKVQISGMTLITNSISEPGVYTSGTGFDRHGNWKRNAVRFGQLNKLFARVKKLEK